LLVVMVVTPRASPGANLPGADVRSIRHTLLGVLAVVWVQQGETIHALG
jgi:hypothetical protein